MVLGRESEETEDEDMFQIASVESVWLCSDTTKNCATFEYIDFLQPSQLSQ